MIGTVITPAITVELRDSSGQLVTSAIGNVSIDFGTNPTGATLGGTKVQPAVNGVATFADLTIDKAGTGYTLVASSTGLGGATSASFAATAPPPPTASPAAPSNLSATAFARNRIDLAWQDNSTNESGFKILRRITGAGTFTQIATTPANATTFADKSVAAQTSYDYQVVATNSVGDSTPSNTATALTPLNVLPRISSTVGAFVQALVDDDLVFTVMATDPDGDPVTLTLLDPPPGLEITPAWNQPSPVSRRVRWKIPPFGGGCRQLVFEARDNVQPQKKTQLSITVQVTGELAREGILIGDVTGDGVLDVVGLAPHATLNGQPSAGEICVWAGKTTPGGAPTATLTIPGTPQNGYLGWAAPDQGVLLADVTGDGIPDIVAVGNGKAFVWEGGAHMIGTPAPKAILDANVPAGSGFGFGSPTNYGSSAPYPTAQGFLVADVTGDGYLDIIVLDLNPDGTTRGVLFVWAGGPSLSGTVSPIASLSDPSSPNGATLGYSTCGQWIFLADVTGDGIADVIVCNGLKIYVWKGGSSLVGAPAPLAVLSDPLMSGGLLGSPPDQGLLLGDVNGDGYLDIIAGDARADDGGYSKGLIFVFAGGPGLSGSQNATAVLGVPTAGTEDLLGEAGFPNGTYFDGRGIVLADVTGDGTLDVVAAASHASLNGTPSQGAVYVFKGGPSLTGRQAPLATLRGAGPWFCAAAAGCGDPLLVGDVTGDGVLDIVVVATEENVGSNTEVGRVYVWQGGPGLVGSPAPLAVLADPAAPASECLGSSSGQGVQLVDVTGDGILDVIVGAQQAKVGTQSLVGAVFVWRGGPSLAGTPAPLATLTPPGGLAWTRLGQVGSGRGIVIADVTGDSIPDLIVGASSARINGTICGAVYVWSGGGTLTGTPSPIATLAAPNGQPNDQLGTASGQGILVADVDADGVLDIVVGASQADIAGTSDTGAVYLWKGGSTLTGTPAPDRSFTVPGATNGDQLGTAAGQAIHLVDLTGDGKLDIVVGDSAADIGGIGDTGAIYFWDGTAPAGTAPAILAVPNAQLSDALGG
jgi:hypothetical protein